MFSYFIFAMDFLDRFQADLALVPYTWLWLAQIGGIAATLVVTKPFARSEFA